MNYLIRQTSVTAIIGWLAICVPSATHAQNRAIELAPQLPLRPTQPGGFLSAGLGTYLTVEGILYDGNGKVESNSLVVDTVNGKKLEKSFQILVSNVGLPAKNRCVLKGYELGAMIGSPPALRNAAEDQGKRYEERSAAAWRWRPYFVVLIAVEPSGLLIQPR